MSILTVVDDATLMAGMLFAAEMMVRAQHPFEQDEWEEATKDDLLAWQIAQIEGDDGHRDPDPER